MPKTKTIAELRRELATKERALQTLTARRSKLARQLSAVDREIAKLGGEAVSAKKRRRRARNKRSLADVLATVLKGKGGVKVAVAGKLALARGYKSSSKQFGNIVSQTLTGDKRFRKVSRGVYALKGMGKTVVKKATRKEPAKKD